MRIERYKYATVNYVNGRWKYWCVDTKPSNDKYLYLLTLTEIMAKNYSQNLDDNLYLEAINSYIL